MGRTWQTETDLEKLKQVALLLLDMDIVTTELAPIIVSHPFTDSGIVGIRGADGGPSLANLLEDPVGAWEWREQVRQQIRESNSALHLLALVTKPYRLGYLKLATPYLSEQDAAQMLAHAWTSSEAPNGDPNLRRGKALELFRSIDPMKLMDVDEYERYQGLDDVVTVYRGVTPYNAKRLKALSWTLNPSAAEWFAHRFGEDGTVYKAQIRKEHIYALFLGRNESEVIVDPKHLQNMEVQMSGHDAPVVGRVCFAGGEEMEYTDPDAYLKAIQEELPYRATSGFHFETLTSDPEVRKAVDDMICDLYGEENPRKLEEYQKPSDTEMTIGGM